VTAPDSATLLSVTFATLVGLSAYVDDVTLDDTTVGGVEERPGMSNCRLQNADCGFGTMRKMVSTGQGALPAGAAYDVLGRRVRAGRPGAGVYFLR
jgi:hypothetical protein